MTDPQISLSCYVKPLRDLIESIKDIVPNVTFIFSDEGVDMQSMDVNKVALVELFIPANSFTSYSNKDDENVTISVDLQSLSKTLKCVKADAVCRMTWRKGADELNMNFKSTNESFSFKLKLLNMQHQPLNIPVRDNDVSFTLPSDTYQNFTKDIAALASDVTINVTEETIGFDFRSDIGNGDWQVDFGENIKLHDFSEEVSQKFSIKYLQNFGRAVQNAGSTDMAMKGGEPIEIVCPLGKFNELIRQEIDVGDDVDDIYPYGFLKFYLAPKTE